MKDVVLKEEYNNTDIFVDYVRNAESKKRLLACHNLINSLCDKPEETEFAQYKWSAVREVREKAVNSRFIFAGDIIVECMHSLISKALIAILSGY